MTQYNRFDPANNFDQIRFRADRVLQSAELNELQSAATHRLRGIADALFKDGDVIRDARIVVDADTGATYCESGAIYLSGAVRGVTPADLVIPVVGVVNVGLYLQSDVVDEIDDPTLLNPAVGTRGYMEPGAERLQVTPAWGYGGDGQAGEFFPVWVVEDGYVRAKEPPPNLDAVTQALARYDRDSAGGTYIVSGLSVAMTADLPTGQQVYTLSEGRARVAGYAIEQAAGRRIVYDAQPDLRFIDSEPHASATTDPQRITLDRPPAAEIVQVRITAQRTVTLTHGGYAGAADPLPETSVLSIVSVTQGATTFDAPGDYKLTAGQVDWSPAGAEPAPGSAYDVTFQYIATVLPTEVDATGFTVEGALPGTLVLVTYTQMLRRIDRLCLDTGGSFVWVRGVAADWTPQPPTVPAELLPLASIYQSWDADRRVIADGVRVVPMNELAGYASRQNAIMEDLAELRLAVDAAGRDSGIKKGLYADPMLSDDMRDAGIAQTAAIVGGDLTLPIAVTVHQVGSDITAPQAPAHTYATVLEQPMRTGAMLVNPYMSFQPPPGETILVPAVDRWTDVETQWNSPVTERLYTGSGTSESLSSRYTLVRTLSETSTEIELLRPVSVAFEVRSFGPGELLDRVVFDGIEVDAEPLEGEALVASADGVLKGRFTIPEGVPAGTKAVIIHGSGGSRGEQFFHGQGTAVLRTQQSVTVETWARYTSQPAKGKIVIGPSTDPLAQTFTLAETCQCAGVDLWFTGKATEVIVQIRETAQGLPTAPGSTAPAEVRLQAADIALGDEATRVTWPPVTLQAGREYALLILCDDATTALSIAELGKWDVVSGRWVTVQPYQVGTLLSSSNASTWTAHQDRDLAFRLLRANYTETERVIDLGTVALDAATDLMMLGYADRPAADADLAFEIALPGGESVQLGDGQPLRLAAPVTGEAHLYARLRGNPRLAAVLAPGVQLIEGHVATSGTYVTRAVNAGVDVTVKVIFEGELPGGSAVVVEMQADGAGPWVAVPYLSAGSPSAGYREIVHAQNGVTAGNVRVRLTLSGTTAARPRVRNLRVITL